MRAMKIQCGNKSCQNIFEQNLGMRVELWGALMCPSCVKKITFPWVRAQKKRIREMYRILKLVFEGKDKVG